MSSPLGPINLSSSIAIQNYLQSQLTNSNSVNANLNGLVNRLHVSLTSAQQAYLTSKNMVTDGLTNLLDSANSLNPQNNITPSAIVNISSAPNPISEVYHQASSNIAIAQLSTQSQLFSKASGSASSVSKTPPLDYTYNYANWGTLNASTFSDNSLNAPPIISTNITNPPPFIQNNPTNFPQQVLEISATGTDYQQSHPNNIF